MQEAINNAKGLIGRMSLWLKENESKVKTFLESKQHEMTVLSAPKWLQEHGEFDIESFQKNSKKLKDKHIVDESLMSQKDQDIEAVSHDKMFSGLADTWTPELEKLPIIGAQSGHKFMWPSKMQLESLSFERQIKLKAIGFAVTTNLQKLKLFFTNGAESERLP